MTSDATTDATTSGATTGHLLRIERGRAEPEELAALMAVLLARAAASGARGPRSGGADRASPAGAAWTPSAASAPPAAGATPPDPVRASAARRPYDEGPPVRRGAFVGCGANSRRHPNEQFTPAASPPKGRPGPAAPATTGE